MGKKNISVLAKFTQDGQVLPQSILWDDGRSFGIDQVYDVRRAASLKAGGVGLRFTCRVRKKQVYLYKDVDQWFMETED